MATKKVQKHRAYQSITPTNNKLLKQRWDQIYFDAHRTKVQHAECVIDNKPPKTYMHLHCKLKKLQMEQERLATVERDNRILMEKMSFTMRTRGRVDNRKEYKSKSLNKTKRQRELLRITHENQAILKRLQTKEPTYHHTKFLHEWVVNQKYMANIAKYPVSWKKHQVDKDEELLDPRDFKKKQIRFKSDHNSSNNNTRNMTCTSFGSTCDSSMPSVSI